MVLFVVVLLFVSKFVLLYCSSNSSLHVLSNSIMDDYGGRHSHIDIGFDGLPFMIYESDKKGAIGVVHCDDIYCDTYTKFYIDNNNQNGFNFANQLYMKMHSKTNAPQFIYSLTNSTSSSFTNTFILRFVTCFNYNCSNYTVISLLNHTFTGNGNNVYVYFTYNNNNNNNNDSIPVISFNWDPMGLFVITCNNWLCTDSDDYKLMDNGNSTGWYNSLYIMDDFYVFFYYNNITFSLNYLMYNYKEADMVYIEGIFINNTYGAWLTTTYVSSNQISMTYVDIMTNEYKYAICNIEKPVKNGNISCNNTIIDRNISDSMNDYELWVYPDITIEPLFNPYPITAYTDLGVLKFAICQNIQCNKNTYIEELANGTFGYGRDTAIKWYDKYNLMYISFLDYDTNGQNKKARLLICSAV